MRYAEIKDGVVVNVIEATEDFASEFGLVRSDVADLGDSFVNGTFVRPQVEDPVAPRVITSSVTRFQAKAALALMKDREGVSYLSKVNTYMATKADEITKLAWTDALNFLRDSPMVTSVGAMLELTSSQIDDLFCFAATIN